MLLDAVGQAGEARLCIEHLTPFAGGDLRFDLGCPGRRLEHELLQHEDGGHEHDQADEQNSNGSRQARSPQFRLEPSLQGREQDCQSQGPSKRGQKWGGQPEAKIGAEGDGDGEHHGPRPTAGWRVTLGVMAHG